MIHRMTPSLLAASMLVAAITGPANASAETAADPIMRAMQGCVDHLADADSASLDDKIVAAGFVLAGEGSYDHPSAPDLNIVLADEVRTCHATLASGLIEALEPLVAEIANAASLGAGTALSTDTGTVWIWQSGALSHQFGLSHPVSNAAGADAPRTVIWVDVEGFGE